MTSTDFDKFLLCRGIKLTPPQAEMAKLIVENQSGQQSWMRARRSGVTFLFRILEEFFKQMIPVIPVEDEPDICEGCGKTGQTPMHKSICRGHGEQFDETQLT